MSELLRELQEDMRQERLQKLWNSFGKVIIGLSVSIVLATIVMVVWKNHQQSRAVERTTQLMKGTDRMKVEDYRGAIAEFDVLSEMPPYRSLAMLQKARAEEAIGEHDKVKKTYLAVSHYPLDDEEAAFVELSRLLEETADASPSSSSYIAFDALLRERAAWQLLGAGKKEEAAAAFASLGDDRFAPQSLRARTSIVARYLAAPKTDAKAADNE